MTCLGFTWRFFTSTLLPHSTMGMFSHTLQQAGSYDVFGASLCKQNQETDGLKELSTGSWQGLGSVQRLDITGIGPQAENLETR